MNWLSFNHVHINYTDTIVLFMEPVECKNLRFIIANQVEVSLKEDTQVYMLLAFLKVESKAIIEDLPV